MQKAKNSLHRQDIRIFQFLAIGVLLVVLLYPLIIGTGKLSVACPFIGDQRHPCPSCGLTTGWGHLFAGQVAKAKAVNGHALPLFLLVLLQIGWRVFLILQLPKIKHPLVIDLMVSGCLIVCLAGPYLVDLIQWLAGSPMLLK